MEDLVQEAMLYAWDFEQRTGKEKHCKSAVIDSVRSLWGDSRNLKAKPQFVPIDFKPEPSTNHIEEKYIEHEWILSRFKDSGLTIAKLVLHGYTFREIGKIFNCSEQAISKLLRYHVVQEKKKH